MSIGLFPQVTEVRFGLSLSVAIRSLHSVSYVRAVSHVLLRFHALVAVSDLEDRFRNLLDARGRKIEKLYFNRGV